MSLLIFVGSLLFFMLIGVPIAYSLIVSSIFLMFHLDLFDSQIIAQNLIDGSNSFVLMAIPFFILAGELMNAGGISKRIINFAISLVGHRKGGLGFVVIIAGILFAGLSGSAVADTAALGAILIPMMVKAGYDRNSASGLVAGTGIIAPVIPPSIAMIMYGVTANVSILDMFIGGIGPGLMMGFGLAIVWYFISRNAEYEMYPKRSFKEIIKAFFDAILALFLPVIIIVGMRGGFFTPTEAAIVAVVYALIIGLFVYRELKIKDLYPILLSTAKLTSVVMFLAAAAMVSAWLITVANLPTALMGIIEPVAHNQTLLLLLIMSVLLLIGMVMDVIPIILIFTPILTPVIISAGIDPVYFGVLFVLNTSIGLLTPPVGSVLNVASVVGKTSLEGVIRGVWPFLLLHIFILLLLILFPAIVTVPISIFN